MTTDDLRRLAEAATPGPWRAFASGSHGAEIASLGSVTIARPNDKSDIEPGDEKADAAFIVAAVDFVRDHLAATKDGGPLTERLANLGYFWGGWYGDDPITPTWRWLLSDGAGNATPASPSEQGLIDLLLARPAIEGSVT